MNACNQREWSGCQAVGCFSSVRSCQCKTRHCVLESNTNYSDFILQNISNRLGWKIICYGLIKDLIVSDGKWRKGRVYIWTVVFWITLRGRKKIIISSHSHLYHIADKMKIIWISLFLQKASVLYNQLKTHQWQDLISRLISEMFPNLSLSCTHITHT